MVDSAPSARTLPQKERRSSIRNRALRACGARLLGATFVGRCCLLGFAFVRIRGPAYKCRLSRGSPGFAISGPVFVPLPSHRHSKTVFRQFKRLGRTSLNAPLLKQVPDARPPILESKVKLMKAYSEPPRPRHTENTNSSDNDLGDASAEGYKNAIHRPDRLHHTRIPFISGVSPRRRSSRRLPRGCTEALRRR
jgi:hypothetical protein